VRRINYVLVLLACTALQVKADESIFLKELPVTANPLGLSNDEMVHPIHIMQGAELERNKSSSLGEMLDNIPGVNNSAWGTSIGRPVIRGMDRNRIKILNNGTELRDVSNMSGDHGVGYDSLASEQIEIVRGPESIIYGGGAIGGVINVIDYRIHPEFVEGIFGKYDAKTGGANNENSGSLLIDYGADNLMFHVDVYKRDSKNLKIPGASVSKRLAESDDEISRDEYGRDTLQNSYSETEGGALGASYFFHKGRTGISFARHEQEYGTILEDGAYIDLESSNIKYELELQELSKLINHFKVKLSYTDYEHKEIEDNATAQDYFDQGGDAKFEFVHSAFSESGGVVGVDLNSFRFSQENGSFAPNSQRKGVALYAMERFNFEGHDLTVGLRHDYHDYDANSFTSDNGAATEGGEETETTFAETEKTFNVTSASIGSSSQISQNWKLGFSLSHTERAPSHDELFVYGEHHATEIIEQGDRSLKSERSNAIDLTLGWVSGDNTFSMTPYYKDFNSYIALLNTGTVQYHEHEHDGEVEQEALPVYRHQNVPAEFYGFEFQGNIDFASNYGLNYWGDFVRAKNKDGGNLPRIPPLTLGTGLYYQWNALNANLGLVHAFSQSDLGPEELKTDDYTDLSMTLNYVFPNSKINAYVKGTNLLDEEIRLHTSFLKDKVLMGERAFSFGLSGSF